MTTRYTQSPQKRIKQWRARRKRDGIEYFLGYFSTKQEAEQAEIRFDNQYPSHKGRAYQ